MVLCVHGEVTDPDVDVFDREAVFIDRVLTPLVARLSRRSRSCSSISRPPRRPSSSTARGPNVAATITPQHLHHQPQRAVRRRPEAARLLPAGRQAREASAGGAQGGDFGLAQILPRHRQRAARARGQGKRLRLRRHLQRAVRARKLCDGVRGGGRARPVRGASPPSNGAALLRPAAQRGHGDAGARRQSRCPTRSTASCRSTPARRCAGASPASRRARAARRRSPRRNALRAAGSIRTTGA